MPQFKVILYNDDKQLASRIVNAATIEDAFQMAENILRKNIKYDDWDCVPVENGSSNKEADRNN